MTGGRWGVGTSLLHRFEDEVHQPDALPERLALYIAGIAYPAVDVDASLHVLEQMAELVGTRLAQVEPGYETVFTFMEVFRIELGFEGNRTHYDEADNSYLNRVLERRTGLPILLSLVCVALARRLGLAVEGVGFPGHFMARYHDAHGDWLLDPFNGQVVAVAAAGDYLAGLLGQTVALPAELFQPVNPAAWAQRMLNNLRNVYLGGEQYAASAHVAGYMLAINPNASPLWRERAVMHVRSEQWERALYDLRRYFFLRGQFSLVWGTDAAREQLLPMLSAQDRQLYALSRRLHELLGRAN